MQNLEFIFGKNAKHPPPKKFHQFIFQENDIFRIICCTSKAENLL